MLTAIGTQEVFTEIGTREVLMRIKTEEYAPKAPQMQRFKGKSL